MQAGKGKCRQGRDAERGGSSHLAPFGSWRAQLSKSIPELSGGCRHQPRLKGALTALTKNSPFMFLSQAQPPHSVAVSDPQPLVTAPQGWAAEPAQARCPGPGSLLRTTAPVKSGGDLRRPPSPRPSGTHWRRSSQGLGCRLGPVPLLAQGVACQRASCNVPWTFDELLCSGGDSTVGRRGWSGGDWRGSMLVMLAGDERLGGDTSHTLRWTEKQQPCLDCHPTSLESQQCTTGIYDRSVSNNACLLAQRCWGFAGWLNSMSKSLQRCCTLQIVTRPITWPRCRF